MTGKRTQQQFYGPFGRFVRGLLRMFSPRYQCDFIPYDEPVVYVCRHLNMHGPYTTLKWIPRHVHPMSLHVFFQKDTAIAQYRDYTLSVRRGKKPRRFSPAACLLGSITVRLLTSLQAVPVHRDASALQTMRKGLAYLLKGESLILWPDKDYTSGYDKPCSIYSGFLLLGEMYRRQTGRTLQFIPLYVDDHALTITQRPAVTANDFRQEGDAAARRLEQLLDPLPCHSVST